MRVLATFVLLAWLLGGLFLTLQSAHPHPGQVVTDNGVPFHTLAIYLRNLGSWFWMRNALGNQGLLSLTYRVFDATRRCDTSPPC